MTEFDILVVAKAPVAGQAKTRLGATVGMQTAAELAAAALADTIESATAAVGADRCHLALSGSFDDCVDGAELTRLVAGWHLFQQRGDGFAERLAHAHEDTLTSGPLVQVGMDTPHLVAADYWHVARPLSDYEAVVAPAIDGGWWAMGVRDRAYAAPVVAVPMSTERTGELTIAALTGAGRSVHVAHLKRDVDTVADAQIVGTDFPTTRFAAAWRAAALISA